jgi:hypothetical protein
MRGSDYSQFAPTVAAQQFQGLLRVLLILQMPLYGDRRVYDVALARRRLRRVRLRSGQVDEISAREWGDIPVFAVAKELGDEGLSPRQFCR